MISSQTNLRTTYIFQFCLIVARRINWYAFISSILLHCNAITLECESSLTTMSTASIAAKFDNENFSTIVVTSYVESDEYFSRARYKLHIYVENFKLQFCDANVRLNVTSGTSFARQQKDKSFLIRSGKGFRS